MTAPPRIYAPRTYLVDPVLPDHVAKDNTMRSRLLYAWGLLSAEDKTRVLRDVEVLAGLHPATPRALGNNNERNK